MVLRSTISAISHAIPSRELKYEELEKRFGKKEVKSIFRMSGIRNRRVVENGQCASDLAFAAAKRLLDEKEIDPDSIDLLTFASQTPDYRIPATASILQGKLKLSEHCCTFDINQACSSFCHSIMIGNSMIISGQAKRALILNGDALSTLINPMDRGLTTLHGDAGTAALLEATENREEGIEFVKIGTDGNNYEKLMIPAGGARIPHSGATSIEKSDESGSIRNMDQLYMDGPSVFHFSVYKVPEVINKFLEEEKKKIDDYDTILLHQANKTMVDLIYRALSVPDHKRFYYLENVGNSSGASLPSLLSEAWRSGAIKPGDRTLLCAFGGGLSWGVISVRWSDKKNVAVAGKVDTPHKS